MTYNLTGLSENATGIYSLVKGVNDNLMDGYFGIIILIVVFCISLITFLISSEDAGKSLVGASFVLTILSMLFVAVDLVPPLAFGIALFVLVGSAGVARYS